jgi:hypothetical protein
MVSDKQELSVRALLWSLPSLAVWMLLGDICGWAIVVALEPDPPPFWAVLLAWPVFTISIGPLIWLRFYRDSGAPGWWRVLAIASVWAFCPCPLLGGEVVAIGAMLFDLGR